MVIKKAAVVLLAVISMFFLLLPSVSAHEDSGNEHREGIHAVTGPEKNKLVAGMLSSKAFKEKKKEWKTLGYHWNGINGAEVEYNEKVDENLIAFPILSANRSKELYFLYAFGQFRGPVPKEFH